MSIELEPNSTRKLEFDYDADIKDVEGEDGAAEYTAGRCSSSTSSANKPNPRIGPGESLVIPAGFKGVFEVIEPVTKHYVIVARQ